MSKAKSLFSNLLSKNSENGKHNNTSNSNRINKNNNISNNEISDSNIRKHSNSSNSGYNSNNSTKHSENKNEDCYAILNELEKLATPKFKPVKDSMDENLNIEFLRSVSENYTYKVTSRGPVCYSALYRDDKYVYRHIILSDHVRQYAESKVRKTNAFLTEQCIINELQIDIGKGWKHFMIYDGKIRELILRKILTAEDKLRMAINMQKFT
ncbi:cyclin-dependent kinases regulatory subunit, putative [Hepatocystis sp. ex Piliocolobus tephrosceles]|nr:cyclin-dependent kinases regulatory subunit, putative [Hepatocystis sp. ex Piliocolobus tephrosceles]